MLDHLDYLVKFMGAEHVGLGLDYVEGYKDAGVVLPQSRRNRTLRPDIFGSVDDFLNQDYPRGLENVRKAGVNVCSGGIIGMGESNEDRIGMLHTLATLPQHPESVPVNALVPVEGTPLEETNAMF